MHAFAAWVRAVLLVTFLVTLVRMLLPDGGLRPFVRLVTGFVVLAVILQPVLNLVAGQEEWRSFLEGVWPGGTESDAAWIAVGEEIARRGAARAADEARRRVTAQIEAVVSLVPEVEAVTVEAVEWTDGGIGRVTLRLTGAAEAGDRRVRELVAKYFGLADALIVTRWSPREGE